MPGNNGWKCSRCTFQHQFPGKVCVMCNTPRITKDHLIDFVQGVPIPESAKVNSSTVSNPEPPFLGKSTNNNNNNNNKDTTRQPTTRKTTGSVSTSAVAVPGRVDVLNQRERPVNQPSAKIFFTKSASSNNRPTATINPHPSNHDRSNLLASNNNNNNNNNSNPNPNENFDPQKVHKQHQHQQAIIIGCNSRQTTSSNNSFMIHNNTNKRNSNRQGTNKPLPAITAAGRNQFASRVPNFRGRGGGRQQKDLPFEIGPVPFDESKISQWIYPINPKYPTRDYQLTMSEAALFENTLISLPTGLGKTLIAAVVLYNYHRWFPTGKLIFCCPTQPLVHQQVEACYKYVGISERETATLTGKTNAEERERLWKERRLFFCTPQTIQNDIDNRSIDIPASKVVCVVLDETHKASGDHSYVKVLELLEREGAKFRVVGLSATPGSNQKAVQDVINVLRVSRIECKSDQDEDIKKYSHERHTEIVVVKEDTIASEIKSIIFDIMRPALKKLEQAGLLRHKNSGATMSTYEVIQAKNHYTNSHDRNDPQYRYNLNNLEIVRLTLEWSNATGYGIGSFRQKILSIHNNKRAYQNKLLAKNEKFQELVEKLKTSFESTQGFTQNEKILNCSPKMISLKKILLEHFARAAVVKENDRNEMKSPSSTRVIVFSQFRDSVAEIVRTLEAQRPIIKPSMFVGQSKGSKTIDKGDGSNKNKVDKHHNGMNQNEQQKVLKAFRDGAYNVLVCTSIGEEGLDIGEVDLIVNFDCLNSPIRNLQRVGRTGRARDGRVVFILTKDEERKYSNARSKEKTLVRALKDPTKMKFHPNNPMLPTENRPQPVRCDKQLRNGDEKFNWDLVGGNNQRKRRSSGEARHPGKKSKSDDDWRLTDREERLRREVLGESIEQCCTTDDSSAYGFPLSLRRRFLKASGLSHAAQTPKDLSRYPLGKTLAIFRTMQEMHGPRYDPSSVAVPRSCLRDEKAAQDLFPLKEENSIACSLTTIKERVQIRTSAQSAPETSTTKGLQTAGESVVPTAASGPERNPGLPQKLPSSSNLPGDAHAIPACKWFPTRPLNNVSGMPSAGLTKQQAIVNPYLKSAANRKPAGSTSSRISASSAVSNDPQQSELASNSVIDKSPQDCLPPLASGKETEPETEPRIDATLSSAIASNQIVAARTSYSHQEQCPLFEKPGVDAAAAAITTSDQAREGKGQEKDERNDAGEAKEPPPVYETNLAVRKVNESVPSEDQPQKLSPQSTTKVIENFQNTETEGGSERKSHASNQSQDPWKLKIQSDSSSDEDDGEDDDGDDNQDGKDAVNDSSKAKLPPAVNEAKMGTVANNSMPINDQTQKWLRERTTITNAGEVKVPPPVDDAKMGTKGQIQKPIQEETTIMIENLPITETQDNPNQPNEWVFPTQSSSSSEDESESECSEKVKESSTEDPIRELPPGCPPPSPALGKDSRHEKNTNEDEGEEEEEDDDDDMPLIAMLEKKHDSPIFADHNSPVFAEENRTSPAVPAGCEEDLSYDADSEVVCPRRVGHRNQRVDPFMTQQSQDTAKKNPAASNKDLADTPSNKDLADTPSPVANVGAAESEENKTAMSSSNLVDTPIELDEPADLPNTSPDSEVVCRKRGKGKRQVDPFLTQHSPTPREGSTKSLAAPKNNLVDTPLQLIAGQQTDAELVDTPSDNRCDDEDVCDLCLCGESTKENPIVYCDGVNGKGTSCNLKVHTSCYSIGIDPQALADLDVWRCDPCSLRHKIFVAKEIASDRELQFVRCCACRKSVGPLKRATKQIWNHPYCAQWTSILPGKGEECAICNLKGAVPCGKEGCPTAVHPHCAVSFLTSESLESWTLLRVNYPDSSEDDKALAMVFCNQHTAEAENIVQSLPGGNAKITIIPPDRLNRRASTTPAARQKPEKRSRLNKISSIRATKDTTAEANVEASIEVIDVDNVPTHPAVDTEEARRSRKRARLDRRNMARQFIDEEAGIGSDDEGDEAEERELARMEADDDASMNSFINDSSQLGFTQDQLDKVDGSATDSGDRRDSLISCYSANDDTLHRRLDANRANELQYATPFLNRKMQRDSLTPSSAPDSEKGLGKMHFVRSVLEHHRNGGDADAIEEFYHKLQDEEREEEKDEQEQETLMV